MEYMAIGIMASTVVLLSYAIYLVVDAGQMTDKEREELGLGPKGQGR